MTNIKGSKGKGAGGGTGRVAQESPNTLQSKAVLRVVEFLSEGEIVGLADGAKSIYLDNTPLQNADGSYNFNGLNYVTRNGTPDQQHITGFPAVESEVAVGVEVTAITPIVRTLTDADTDAVAVTIRIPTLTEQDTANGDLFGSSVQIKIEYQPNGGSYIEAVSPEKGTITGKTTSPYERQYRFNLTGNAPWNIRVTRITPDSAVSSIQNKTFFASYTRIVDHKLIYPDTALIGLEVDSTLFGQSIPQRSYDLIGLICQVPSNYNPTTRVYTGIWDGTFQRAWTNNPAWVLYDLMTNSRYALGTYIEADLVDKFALYTIGQYCDELVDNGAGGTEPRFTFNGVIETQEEALKVLQVVASAFRGMLYWGAEGSSGVVTAVHDAPSDPVKIFTPANVKHGLFTYATTSADARHSAAYVTWNDPSNNYAPAIEVVENENILAIQTYRKIDVVAYGCTSRGQAHRFGKWILDSEEHENETVKFICGLADADIRPGNVIKIQDPAYADVRYGGRLLAATTTSLTLDAPIEIKTGESYLIDVVMPDGSLETKTITNAAGTHSVLTVSSAFSVAPDSMTMWAVTASDIAPRTFRVIGVKENSPAEFEVFALLHDTTKYDRVENDINLPEIPFTRLTTGVIQPPTEMTYQEFLFNSGPLLRSAVSVSWKASPDGRVVRYELEAKSPGSGQTYQLAKVTNGVSHVIEGTTDGTWSFRVRAFDALGNASAYLTLADVTLVINGLPPANVENFQITNLSSTALLSWDAVTSKNISHYEIRYSSVLVGASWNSSSTIVERVAKDATSIVVASRTGTFLIKAVSIPTAAYPQGVYSQDAALISTNVDFINNFNFVEDLVEDPTFTGTKTDVVVNAGNLELDTISANVHEPYGVYNFHDIIDLGDVFTSRITPHIVVAGSLTTNSVDNWDNVDDILNVDGVTDGQWAVEMQLSYTQDDPGGSPTWTDYATLDIGDITARGLRFRVLLWSYSDAVTPSIEELSVQVDMPDLIQSGENLTTSSSVDTVVNFPFAYRSTRPAVVITAQSLATGDYVLLDTANVSSTGFTFSIRNAAGSRVVRTFDYHAKGYGRVS